MKLSQSSLSKLETAVKKAIGKYSDNSTQNIVTDFHLQVNQGSGELVIYNDDDEKLSTAIIEEWAAYDGENFDGEVEEQLSTLLNKLKKKGTFDAITSIMKPYSFVLVDEEKETMAELLLIDDDTLMVNDELLKGLDEELDAFLKDLLEK